VIEENEKNDVGLYWTLLNCLLDAKRNALGNVIDTSTMNKLIKLVFSQNSKSIVYTQQRFSVEEI
jgi:hypothetical protein